ncbi:hypothetical protein TBLA_0A09640 [Henningerozyma blattae CBS 6284]|uniref:RING-type E3 ubiquitin transferase n=1 Tax=Henningerozyma blattae (strain ATCC 34711 / CBS 6284 / DSM 70876 / NBRC 10599 / NRRL Y-10934 / UCD 77-7) TaxID=1071380 RepID=I2GX96_HENB6|nr:hypothetical protein TBLA_0A09640 [Tetrapisispora blattae CBS 6284]CCH58748.1 hypothetical protein TBLA_0A09640 [Tetrapisispora blattae CBS 6284]
MRKDSYLPLFADAPTILQAHQKDEQVESILTLKIREVLRLIKGQLFINLHPNEIALFGKLLYLSITTLRGKRTLGEEYTDLFIVNRKGTNFVKRYKRLLFVLSYLLGPYLLSKISNALKYLKVKWNLAAEKRSNDESKTPQDEEPHVDTISQYFDGLNRIANLHLLLFYFTGAYYDLNRRLFGLRYAISHKLDNSELEIRRANSKSYRILGYILSMQLAIKGLPYFKAFYKTLIYDDNPISLNKVTTKNVKYNNEKIDLKNPKILPYIPEESRKCILCMSFMINPSCAPCGHIYCWNCLINWCKEKEECPLCRQKCDLQEILPLR